MNRLFKLLIPAVMILVSHVVTPVSFAAEGNPLADVRVRQAIAYAIDMDTIVATIFGGKAIVADSMIPNGPLKAPGLNKYSYDPEKARFLLAEANYDTNQSLDIVYYYGDQQTADLMAAIQSYLGEVGIKVTYRLLQGDIDGQMNALPGKDTPETSGITWNIGYGARAGGLAMQGYYNVYRGGMSSYVIPNAERDTLIDAINATTDPEELKQAFFAIERFENAYLTDIPLYYQQLFNFDSDRLDRHGEPYGDAQFNYDWGIVNWTVAPDETGKHVAYTDGAPTQFFVNVWLQPGLYVGAKVLFDRLLTADPSVAPSGGQLAESYSVSDDSLTVSFKLHDGLTWHDGEPLTAEDVKWSIEMALKVPTIESTFSNTFNSIQGAKEFKDGTTDSISGIVADGQTLTISLAKVDPNVLSTFAQFAPLPKHLLADANPLKFQQDEFWQHPIGSGPFKLGEVQMNDFASFVPFENYYGGKPKIDEIVAFPSGDNDANVLKYAMAHRLDFGFTKSTANADAIQKLDYMKVVPVDTAYTRSLRINAFPKKSD